MSPVTHILISWSVANACPVSRRERLLVTLAGILPDIDGAGLLFDLLSSGSGQKLQLWSKYHHVLGHNIGFGLFMTLIAWLLATRRWLSGGLVLLSFHLHLLGDLVGSKGPDGDQWPIPYLQPFSEAWQWTWSGQWLLNAWPNFVVTVIVILLALYFAWKRGISPLEMVSQKANNVLVETLRNRFGRPAA